MHEEVLLPKTRKLLVEITSGSLPRGSYLGGGTAVALHLGHRRSKDLDFFTPSKFREKQWERKLSEELGFRLIERDWQTLVGSARGVKLSLFYYPQRMIGKKTKLYGVSLASVRDLAAMKLEAIVGRSTKRDLMDIYFLGQKFSLAQLFRFYQEKYGNLSERRLMIKKSLVYFEEADEDEMPDVISPVSWPQVKKWLLQEVVKV